MSHADPIERLNSNRPPFIELLNGRVIASDSEEQSCTFEFRHTKDHCHSIDVVQGGFITVMLDAAMSHAVFARDTTVERLSSLEITTRYESVTRGQSALTVTGWIRRMTRTIAFLEADIKSESGEILAIAHSVAKIGRKS